MRQRDWLLCGKGTLDDVYFERSEASGFCSQGDIAPNTEKDIAFHASSTLLAKFLGLTKG